MTAAKFPFTSPTGRFVQGDVFKPSDKDQNGAPRTIKTGPNAGQPNPQYFMAVAFAKTDPAWPAYDAVLKQAAAAGFPHLFPAGPHGGCSHPQFSYKVIDGDGVDTAGKRWADREGFAGHWIVRFTRGAVIGAPPVWQETAPGSQQYVACSAGRPRTGDYVRVNGDVMGNDNVQRPGIYVNLGQVLYVGEGPEIVSVSGPTAAEAFGGSPAPLPVGAAPIPPGAAAGAAALIAPPPAAPSPGNVPAAAPTPPPPVPVRQMTPAANGIAYEAYIAQGWTDDQLRASGYLV